MARPGATGKGYAFERRRPTVRASRSRVLAGVWAAALAAMLGGGCDDATSAEIWCSGLCEAEVRCFDAADGCVGRCVDSRSGLVNLSVDGVSAEKSCLAQLPCGVFLDDGAWSTELDACWDQAQAKVEIRPRVRAFCGGFALKQFDCGYTFAVDDCQRIYAMWSDAVLAKLEACEARAICDDFEACVQNVFDNL